MGNSIKKFLVSFLVCFSIVLAVLIIALFLMVNMTPAQGQSTPSNVLDDTVEEDVSTIDAYMSIPKKTNFLIMGLDQGEALSDVMMVGSFDSQVGSVELINIPRDTKITLSDEMISEMNEDGHYPPRTMKMNALHSYAGDDGAYYTEKFLEEEMGIQIDYYAEINTEAFRYIVDSVGGIWFDVRDEGYYYNDPYQDLYIDIDGGYQLLDGAQAEGLVRYRHDYAMGDIQRVSVQQEFITAFFDQVLDTENIIDVAPTILQACYEYVTTDFPVSDIPKYIPYISVLDPDNFSMTTLPGTTVENSPYYIANEGELQMLVDNIFYSTNIDFDEVGLENAKIQVLNGSSISGLAEYKQNELTEAGYDVENIGNYTGSSSSETKIITNYDYDVSALYPYFTNPEHVIDNTVSSFYDITIILGRDEPEPVVEETTGTTSTEDTVIE